MPPVGGCNRRIKRRIISFGFEQRRAKTFKRPQRLLKRCLRVVDLYVARPLSIPPYFADLKLAQPDKLANLGVSSFGQQNIKLVLHHISQAFNNTRFNPPFSGDKGVRAQALYNRYSR